MADRTAGHATHFRRSGLFVVDPYKANNPKNDDYCLNEQAMPTSLEIEEVNMAINHFRAKFFFWEQATPTSLEIEEEGGRPRDFRERRQPQRGDQSLQSWVFFFESKQRLLAWKLKKFRFVYVYVSFSGEMKAIYDMNWYINWLTATQLWNKEDGLRFVLRGNEGYLQRELIYKVITRILEKT